MLQVSQFLFPDQRSDAFLTDHVCVVSGMANGGISVLCIGFLLLSVCFLFVVVSVSVREMQR